MPRWTYADVPDLSGRTALVTGANSGIGRVAARVLAQHGADVVLAVRRPHAGEEAAERIRLTGAPGRVTVEELDLASLESVRALAERLGDSVGGRLDLLLANAGVMTPPRYRETRDGFELQFVTMSQKLVPPIQSTTAALAGAGAKAAGRASDANSARWNDLRMAPSSRRCGRLARRRRR